MTISVNETCDICNKTIRKDEEIIKLKSGISRGKGLVRTFFGIINSSSGYGIGYIHVQCLDNSAVKYNYQNPNITLDQFLKVYKK